jgi:type 1 glutamine amidotransferase
MEQSSESTASGGRLLAITGGHRFDFDAFREMLDAVCAELGWQWVHAEHPEAMDRWRPDDAVGWDAILLHDIPGLTLERGAEPIVHEPADDLRREILAAVELGVGIVATHHSLAGWPAWDDWASMLGGRFLYAPGRLRGEDVPPSGYRMTRYRVIVDPRHPICAGVEDFEVDDELYLCPVFESEVDPFLATDADLSPAAMIDTYREVRFGERVAAQEQPGSRHVGWSKTQGRSRIVYLLPGHGPDTMGNEQYRRLLTNACRWVRR